MHWYLFLYSFFEWPADLEQCQESEYFDSDEAGAIFKLDKPEEISDFIKAALEGRLKVFRNV